MTEFVTPRDEVDIAEVVVGRAGAAIHDGAPVLRGDLRSSDERG